jgi:prophage tail gpP-like protein
MAVDLRLDEPTLSIKFAEVDAPVKSITEYELDSSFLTSTDSFRASMVKPTGELVTAQLELRPVELYIDNQLQMVGRVDRTTRGDHGVALRIEGRDYMADLVECNIDPSFKIEDNEEIEAIILRAAKVVGIIAVETSIDSWRDTRTGGILHKSKAPGASIRKLKAKDYKPNPGQGLYEYLSRLVARHGGTLQPVGERTRVAIAAPNYIQDAMASIVRRQDNPDGRYNNVLAAVAVRDYSHFPTVALATGKIVSAQMGEVAEIHSGGEDSATSRKIIRALTSKVESEEDINIGETASSSQEVEQSAEMGTNITETVLALVPERVNPITKRLKPGEFQPRTPEGHALYRFFYLRDEESKDQGQLDRSLMRAVAERMKDALQYSVTLRGHRDPETGRVWATDTIVHVQDELCQIDEPLWVEKRTFAYDASSGPTTKLTMWRPGSFSLGNA